MLTQPYEAGTVIIIPILPTRKGTERSSDLPEITQLPSDRARSRDHGVCY